MELACLEHGSGQQKEQYADKLRIPLRFVWSTSRQWSEILILSIVDPAVCAIPK